MSQVPLSLVHLGLDLLIAWVGLRIVSGFSSELRERDLGLPLGDRHPLPCAVQIALGLIQGGLRRYTSPAQVLLAVECGLVEGDIRPGLLDFRQASAVGGLQCRDLGANHPELSLCTRKSNPVRRIVQADENLAR